MVEIGTLLGISIFAFSILLLVKGSDLLTDSASKTAKIFGVSDFAIGVTIVAIGTSLPELASAGYASYIGKSNILVGDIIGSNITNIALILGLVCIIKPLPVRHTEIYSGRLHLFILTAASIVLVLGSGLGWIAGIIFVSGYFLYLRKVVKEYRTVGTEHVPKNSLTKNIIGLCIGLIAILIGARLLVNSIISIAETLGIPEYTVSLLLMAFGTSLPEVSTTITAARKGYSTMAFGSIIGSNIANILWVMGIAAIINPFNIEIQQMLPAIIMMLLLAVFIIRFKKSQYTIERKEGIVLVAFYSIFVLANIFLL